MKKPPLKLYNKYTDFSLPAGRKTISEEGFINRRLCIVNCFVPL